MDASTRPNKNFSVELKAFQRSWQHGTKEYKMRKSYPGHIPKCDDPDCVNSKFKIPNTYSLCDDCSLKVPDTLVNFIHAPTKNLVSKTRRRRQSVFAFIAHLLLEQSKAARKSESDVVSSSQKDGDNVLPQDS